MSFSTCRDDNTLLPRNHRFTQTGSVGVLDWVLAAFLVSVAALQPTDYWYLSSYAAYVAIAAFILTFPFQPHVRLIFMSSFWIVIALLVWLGVTAYLSPHAQTALTSWWYLIKVWSVAFLVMASCRNHRQLALYLKAIVVGSFVLSISGAVLGFAAASEGGARELGLTGQPNAFGMSLFHGFLAGMILFSSVGRIWKFILLLYFAAAFVAVMASGSRQAAVATMAAAGAYAVLEYGHGIIRRPYRIVPGVVLLVVPVLLAVWLFPESPLVVRSSALVEGQTGSTSGRIDIFLEALDLITDRPLRGYGIGTFGAYSNVLYTHSSYLELLFGGGALALILYYALYLQAWWLIWRLRELCAHDAPSRKTLNAWRAALIGLLVHGAFAAVYSHKLPTYMIAGLLGFAVAQYRQMKPQRASAD